MAIAKFLILAMLICAASLSQVQALTDLGLASRSSSAIADQKDRAMLHQWSAAELGQYRLTYVLSKEDELYINEQVASIVRDFSYRTSRGDKYWNQPPGCRGYLDCVYDRYTQFNWPSIRPISERFAEYIIRNNLNAEQAAALVVSFVQAIQYKLVNEEAFGLLSPSLVGFKKHGDCDSHALLAHILLNSLGIDTVMILSRAHNHAMIAVGFPRVGSTSISHRGTRYTVVEVTPSLNGYGVPIGIVPSEWLTPFDWVTQSYTYKIPYVIPEVRSRMKSASSDDNRSAEEKLKTNLEDKSTRNKSSSSSERSKDSADEKSKKSTERERDRQRENNSKQKGRGQGLEFSGLKTIVAFLLAFLYFYGVITRRRFSGAAVMYCQRGKSREVPIYLAEANLLIRWCIPFLTEKCWVRGLQFEAAPSQNKVIIPRRGLSRNMVYCGQVMDWPPSGDLHMLNGDVLEIFTGAVVERFRLATG